MKFSIPLKDIMIAPGKCFDPAENTGQDVIIRIKKLYGVIAEVMDIVIDGEMVHIEFREATPEKHKAAMEKLRKGIEEAQQGQPAKALNLFKGVLLGMGAILQVSESAINLAPGNHPIPALRSRLAAMA